ncbi:homeobox-leucine zipper protein HAT7-like [Hibiscus syriacus]|uniref:Homeobox-leucine zipper protein HAT7-like n=1 Tax=Hibiscus syriacus TaxID=106335 RepID=A0A6A2X3M6_HIBSY|nr:uncharacterized protein At3g28850-like [Hibiscus syriacus]KAE8669602.1 homeobox-leucine zipper protein HAT7-like [Hibiscus syriacus]
MGCASSKPKRCRHCRRAPFSPVPRSYSMHVHHPAQHKGDSYHVVALTSTTLGSLKLEDNHRNNNNGGTINVASFSGNLENGSKINGDLKQVEEGQKVLAMEVIEAKLWSKMIEDKIPKVVPKTPIRTPPGEPETINTWEMMAGLEDISPLRFPGHFRSFSFDVPKPGWLQIEDKSDLGVTDFDPEIISGFRESLQQLPREDEKERDSGKKVNGVKGDKVVLYFTSLRGVRRTYEDCCDVRVILKSLGVRIDERDVSMHSGFKGELKELIGEGFNGGLPRVFVGGKYIGGAEEIRRMHEDGELDKAVQGCEMADNDGGGNGGACEACGDIRFVPCETCSGSCKVYYEDDEMEENEQEGDEMGECGFQRCPDCNENGLIRCPICYY